jgi:hypothetical protein
MPVPCYGCGQTLRVDRRWPEQGLLLAGWTLTSGETFCRACALARGFSDPRGFEPAAETDVATTPEAGQSTPPSGIAVADAETSGAVRRYLRGALITIVVGLSGLVAVFVVVALQVSGERAAYASGIHTNGVIVALHRCACGGPATVSYHVGTETLVEREVLPRDEPAYSIGESIDVSYDPARPSHLNSPVASIPPAWGRPLSLAGVLGLVLLIGGLAGARRASRWRVLLADAGWRAYRLTYIPVPYRSAGLLLTPDESSGEAPLNLRLGSVFRWRSAILKTANGRAVWLAGDPAREVVLAVHPGPVLFPTRPVAGPYQKSYWKAAVQTDAMRALGPAERRAAVAKAYRRSELRVVLAWGCLGLFTISQPSTLAWIVLIAESLVWGLGLVRLRLARERALEEPDLTAGSENPALSHAPG